MIERKLDNKGVTLIEMVLALLLVGLLVQPVTLAIQLGADTWNSNRRSDELSFNARTAMSRIILELKYATSLTTVSASDLVFDTVYFVNDTPDVETIRYSLSASRLNRSQGGGPNYAIAGANESWTKTIITVEGFTATPLKSDGTDLIPLGGSPLSDTDAIQLDLSLADSENVLLDVTNIVLLRN